MFIVIGDILYYAGIETNPVEVKLNGPHSMSKMQIRMEQ